MKIQNVEMQYQNSSENKNIIMNTIPWQKEPDTIGLYGCKVVAHANAYNLYHNNKKFLTVKELNSKIIKNNGYKYLWAKSIMTHNISAVRAMCFEAESELLDSVLFPILGIKECVRFYEGEIDLNAKKDFYIIKTRYKGTGHFSLVIGNNYKYVDSYNAKIVIPTPHNILEVRKIIFK